MKVIKNIFYRNPLFTNCPECKAAGTLRRSRGRNTKELIIKKLTPFKFYRCRTCGWRGVLSTVKITGASLKVLMFYLSISALAGFIVFQFLKRY